MKILKLLHFRNNVREIHRAAANPVAAIREFVIAIVEGYLALLLFWAAGITGFLALLAYTGFMGGPYELAQTLLLLFLIVLTLFIASALFLAYVIKKRVLEGVERVRRRINEEIKKYDIGRD